MLLLHTLGNQNNVWLRTSVFSDSAFSLLHYHTMWPLENSTIHSTVKETEEPEKQANVIVKRLRGCFC